MTLKIVRQLTLKNYQRVIVIVILLCYHVPNKINHSILEVKKWQIYSLFLNTSSQVKML